MGNDFMRLTGLDPADPANWMQSTDFALLQAKQHGWGAWYGAKAAGINGFYGIDRTAPTPPLDVSAIQQQIAAHRQLAQTMQQTTPAIQNLQTPLQGIGQAAQQVVPPLGNVQSGMTGMLEPLMQAPAATGQFSNALTQLIQQLMGGFGGGGLLSILGLASGGYVSGPGTSTSDSIPAMLSDGEFVVNAAATRRNRALLEAINSGRVPKFASGGIVGRDSFARAAGATVTNAFAPNISIRVEGGSRGEVADHQLAEKLSRELDAVLEAKMAEFAANQMRNGGMLRGAYR